MRILFVFSGNREKTSPVIKNQADSIRQLGVNIDYFPIRGKGTIGYLKNYFKLKHKIKKGDYNIVHSHYAFSGMLTSLTGAKKQVVSLMGSDVNKSVILRFFIRIFARLMWDECIVKSTKMKKKIKLNNAYTIPNGVDISKFKPIKKSKCIRSLGWDLSKKNILFAANPDREVKNFSFFKKGFEYICSDNQEINYHVLKDVPNEKVPIYMNASDVVCLTSKWEGSPNVIKEAMACNRPIVCTDVGDVKWLFDENKLEGHFISDFDANSFGNQLVEAMNFSEKIGETKGRNRIKSLNLDSSSISKKLIQLYDELLYQSN